MSDTSPHQPPRIVMYSHDTMGMGHIRRNLLIAQALAKPPVKAQVLLISGIRQAGSFPLPPGVDLVTLPAYRKDPDGSYHPQSLGDDVDLLVRLRAGLISAALKRYPCDLFIVDNVPRGALGELAEVLAELRAHGRTRCVLGLRDVLDEPAVVQRQWRRQRNHEAVRQSFDEIWVYGDSSLYDTATEYGFDASLRERIRQVGYLDPLEHHGAGQSPLPAGLSGSSRPGNAGPGSVGTGSAGTGIAGTGSTAAGSSLPGRFSLCVVGGGQDGWRLAETFARATFPPGEQAVIVCGMRMPEARRRRLAEIAITRPHVRVLDFVTDPIGLMRGARRIVSMGGYNTVTEILSLGCKALVVPRVRPRLEQWIRAERLAALGLIDVLHPDALSTRALGRWLMSGPDTCPDVRTRLRFDGLARVRQRVQGWLLAGSPAAHKESPDALA